jgi:hypothetical protein
VPIIIEHGRAKPVGAAVQPKSTVEALGKIERFGEEQRPVGTAANFSRGAWC